MFGGGSNSSGKPPAIHAGRGRVSMTTVVICILHGFPVEVWCSAAGVVILFAQCSTHSLKWPTCWRCCWFPSFWRWFSHAGMALSWLEPRPTTPSLSGPWLQVWLLCFMLLLVASDPSPVTQAKSYSFGRQFLGLDKCNACVGTSICKKFFKEEIR